LFTGRIKIFHSATSTFVLPSDPSGIGSMQREYIRAMPSWGRGQTVPLSLGVARIFFFYSH
ncbi:hypothetical protein BU15DRAFT_57302, partial [Melanogaster broomeanus]